MFGRARVPGTISGTKRPLESLMHWTRVSLFCLSAALLASGSPALAQAPGNAPAVVQLDDLSGSVTTGSGGNWVQFDTMAGDGVGWQTSYQRFGARYQLLQSGDSQLFMETNGWMNNQRRMGTNLNLGARTMYDGGVAGAFVGYDNLDSNYGHNYQQAVVGGEYLHEWLDLRANGYMPFGNRDNFIGVLDPGTQTTFFGHDFGTIGTGQTERSLAGFDAEAGVPLPVATFIRTYVGPYYLTAAGDDTWGVRSRVEARVGQSATLNFQVTNDDRFGTNLNFNATIWYGGHGSPFKFMRDRSGWARQNDPIRRQNVVQLAQDHTKVNVPLINTDTGSQFNITWVDNTATAPGNGTVEHPFTSLPNNAPGSDYILVRRGVGNTVGNIALENNQHMFGEGRVYTLNTDRLGTVEIPDAFFDQTGTRPNLLAGNPALPVITLADNNQVINFNIQGGGVGIFGATVHNFDIEHIAASATNGIFISDASSDPGRGILNNIDAVASGAGTGVFLRNLGPNPLNLNATDITATGGSFGFQLLANNSTANANIDGLITDQTSDTGIVLQEINGAMNVNLANYDVRNSGGATTDGVLIDATLGTMDVNLTDGRIRGFHDLLAINATNTTINVNSTNLDASFSTSPTGDGVQINADNSIGNFMFTNLRSVNNGEDGFQLTAINGSVIDAQIHDSNVSFNTDDNFDVQALSGSTVTFLVDPTQGTDAGDNAFRFFADGPGSLLDATFKDVDLARAGSTAISGDITNAGIVNLKLTNVQASDSGLDGLAVALAGGSVLNANVADSSFTRSGIGNNGFGVNINAVGASTANLVMTNTAANNNGQAGFNFNIQGGSTMTADVTNGNFSDNPVNNVVGSVQGPGSTATFHFTDVTADLLASAGGVKLATTGGGVIDGFWDGASSSISQTDSSGVILTADGPGSKTDLRFHDGLIRFNAFNGVNASATNGGLSIIELTNVDASQNTNENVRGAASTGGAVSLFATNTNLSQGGLTTNLDNVFMTSTGAGSIVAGTLDGVNLDNSGLNGLHIDATLGGNVNMSLISTTALSSASNNANGHGVLVTGTNAGNMSFTSSGILGPNNISNNFLDNVRVDIAGANIADIGIAGTMDNSTTGDGVHFVYDAVNFGSISIGTGASASNNALGDGIDILVTNSNLDQGLSIVGMNVVDNGGEPIKVITSNSTITGGQIASNTISDSLNGASANGILWDSDSGTVDVNINNNTITAASPTGPLLNGILVNLHGTAVGNDVHIDSNTVVGDGVAPVNGIQLLLQNTASLTNGTINFNNSSGAGQYGILTSVNGLSSVASLTMDGNNVTNNGLDGIAYLTTGNTSLTTLAVANNILDGNAGNGVNVNLNNVTGTPDVTLLGNLSTNNGANGIVLTAVDTSLNNVIVTANEADSNTDDGIRIDLSSPSGINTLASLSGQNNTANSNVNGAGINILLDNFNTAVIKPDVNFSGTTANSNGAEGLAISVTDMDLNTLVLDGSSFTTNGADGIAINLLNNATAGISIQNLASSGNTLNGLNLNADNSDIGVLVIQANNGFSNNTQAGILIGMDNASTLAAMLINSNDISSNGTNGIQFDILNGSTLPTAGLGIISNNTITGQLGGDGINLINPNTGGAAFSLDIDNNTITGNSGNGVNIATDGNAGTLTGTLTNNTISSNGSNGVNLATSTTGSMVWTAFTNNVVNSNQNMGVRITTSDNSLFLFEDFVGGNTLTGNRNAGFGALLQDNSTADLKLSNSTITNTVAGADANFNGEGIAIVLNDTATLLQVSLFDGNTISGTAGPGFSLLAIDSSVVEGLGVTNSTISNTGGVGIRFERQDTGQIGTLARVDISGNTVTGVDTGVFIIAANTDSTDFYQLNDNTLDNLGGRGVHFEVRADADIDANMDNNSISNNGQDGILITEQVNAASDSRSVTGTWTNNTITNNGRHGINITGATGGLLTSLVIGDIAAVNFPPPLGNGNLISGNNNDGISVTGPGNLIVIGNSITDNGSNGQDDAGIDFHGATNNNIAIINNEITLNHGDGIQYEGDGSLDSTAIIDGNNISFNDAKGFDLLVQPSGPGGSNVDITFNDNIVTNNQQEGVYVIFTASRTQQIGVSSTNALASDGNFDDRPTLRFSADNNSIHANGLNSGFNTTGLVVRVGTTDARQNPNNDGGFASDGVGNFTRSGVIMDLTNNNLGGNFGNDIYFDSFVSTVTPPTSAGTWGTTNDPTAITTYRQDPLARMDMTFIGNTFDAGAAATTNVGAFYNNAEGTFKSRLNTTSAPNVGPFTADTRRRNAQRQASRWTTGPFPLPPGAAGNFLYSGMGNSTFRVSAGSDLANFVLDDPTLSGSPTQVDAFGEAQGAPFGGAIFGEQPFGWGTF